MFKHWLGPLILTLARPLIAQGHSRYNVTQARQVAPRWLDPYVLGCYLPGVTNDVFNGMEIITSYRLTMSRACVAWRRVVRPPNTIVVHHVWVAGRHYTIAACYDWPADCCCPAAVLQTPCPHVLLAFIVPPAACHACAWYRPCRVVSWKIRAHPDGRS
jgi:hypothetical protein